MSLTWRVIIEVLSNSTRERECRCSRRGVQLVIAHAPVNCQVEEKPAAEDASGTCSFIGALLTDFLAGKSITLV